MNTIADIKNCCGCRACEYICPKNCIHFTKDGEGFVIPTINEDECVQCGKCWSICSQRGYEHLNSIRSTYAAVHKDREILMDSTSGGGMTSIAEIIINNGGIVYGAYLDPGDWKVKFTGAEKTEDLHKLRGSKYVQADTGKVYIDVKNNLLNEREVLFVGTPCQVAGLYSYLGNSNREHLTTIDLLCHGVPASDLFVQHVQYLERKYKRKLTGFAFRDKSKFPNKTALRYEFGNKKVYVLGKCEFYFQIFSGGLAYRQCCYECQYATSKHPGDITLGDYWGIRKFHPQFDNSLGVSLILTNSEKGERLIKKANLTLVQSNIEKAWVGNGILRHPSEKPNGRDTFYKDVDTMGYEAAAKKYVKPAPMIYNAILTHLPQKVISILSKIR